MQRRGQMRPPRSLSLNSDNTYVHSCCNLSSYDIKQCRKELRDILIAPFDEAKCKGVGYNLSPSELCYSVNSRCLLRVHRTAQEVYVMIPAHDTVLTLSHEYLQVGPRIAGCFLSRLRPVTKGLGNISTTLDPCWKGMLLLSINNPSSRAVKLTISQVAQDRFVPVALTTMLIWYIPQMGDDESGVLTFHLDNPAMRTDIWTELTAEPYKLLGNKEYQHFQRVIERLSTYTPSAEEPEWIMLLQKQLDRLYCAIHASPWKGDTVREILLCIYHLECDQMPQELLSKLHKLYTTDGRPLSSFDFFENSMEETLDKLERQNNEQYLEDIYLAYQECNYQRLCFQVKEIHDIIKNECKYIWRWDTVKRIFHCFVCPHIGAIFASLALAFLLLLPIGDPTETSDYITRIVISIVPVLLSFVLNWKK